MSLAAQKLKSTLSKRLLKFSDPTVWHVFSPLAVKSKAVNLGQGFPGWHPPAFVKQALKNAVDEPDFMVHQYARAAGHMKLAQALSQRYATKFKREIDPATEVTVHNGASQALATAMLGLLNPDDEVVVLQPAFDLYFAQAELCGAVVNGVSLETRVNADSKQQEWFLDMKKLEASFTDKTRVFILNTPHNPTGKVFSPAELAEISAILVKFPNIVVLSDEVYDTMVYAPNKHTSIATLPGMWDKTLTINSAGKCFSVTGWKIGWAVGPPHLVASTSTANQWLSFACNTPAQEAIATALVEAEKPYESHPTYWKFLNAEYLRKRQILADALQAVGITPIMPEGTFFIIGDTSGLEVPAEYAAKFADSKHNTRDWIFCHWLTEVVGVAAIPPSAFYSPKDQHMAANYARFAFCKPDSYLETAAARLKAHFNK